MVAGMTFPFVDNALCRLAAHKKGHAILVTAPHGYRLNQSLQKRLACGDFCSRLDGPDWRYLSGADAGVEAIREANGFFYQAPEPGSRKVLWVDDADLLTTAAQNAFLKTLEEPPVAALLLLSSENPANILPTIRSRCVHLSVPTATVAELTEHLQSLGVHQAEDWLNLVERNPSRAIEAADALDWEDMIGRWPTAFDAFLSGKVPHTELLKRWQKIPEWALMWLQWRCRESLRQAVQEGSSTSKSLAILQGRLARRESDARQRNTFKAVALLEALLLDWQQFHLSNTAEESR